MAVLLGALPTSTDTPTFFQGHLDPDCSPLPLFARPSASLNLGKFLVWQEAQTLTNCMWVTVGGRVLSSWHRTLKRESRLIQITASTALSSVLSMWATSSYCPCPVPQLPECFPNVLSGGTIYPFVFAATADPLRARSISAVKIIPVKTVKSSSGLVLPPGTSPWVGFFFSIVSRSCMVFLPSFLLTKTWRFNPCMFRSHFLSLPRVVSFFFVVCVCVCSCEPASQPGDKLTDTWPPAPL